jgi:hypothetical protein
MAVHRLIVLSTVMLAGCAGGASPVAQQPPDAAPIARVAPPASGALLEDVERRTFDYFWVTTNASTGLAPDRYPASPFSSIAALGFALTAYPAGIERGYVTRAQGADRVLTTLRFLHDLPQGPGARGVAGYRGFFYHFLDM